ncbi:MAG: DUF547 domain-containing protein [Tepidisphaeraceae bacterium]
MKTATTSLLIVLLAAVSARARVDHSGFDNLLKNNVRDGGVDYDNIKRHELLELQSYLDMLALTDFATLAREEQLACYINLYNAAVISAICQRYGEGYTPSERDFALFKEPVVQVNGRRMSLNDLENNVIRAQFKDPRVHAALVCGSRSCPPILPRAYRAKDLEPALAANMKAFVNDATRNQVDRAGKKLVLSRIFDWYADDFGGKDALPAYVSMYVTGDPVVGYTVAFSDYDWTLNDARP